MMIRGAYTALVTPFDSHGRLDEEGFISNIQFQIENNIDGLVPLGTTGEAPTLQKQEQERIIRIAVDEAKGKVPVMVGTGNYSTQQTIENTIRAEQLGANAALIVCPYYNKPTQEGIFQHFSVIAKSVSIPIIVYNIQSRTGQNISTDTLKRLSDIPNIVGVKESSGNIIQMTEVIESIGMARKDFSILSGDDPFTLPLMSLGGHGVISVISNLRPYEVKSLVQAASEGDFETARLLHFQLVPLIRAAFLETNPIPIKFMMQLEGMPSGVCRLPLCSPTPETQEKLKQILSQEALSELYGKT